MARDCLSFSSQERAARLRCHKDMGIHSESRLGVAHLRGRPKESAVTQYASGEHVAHQLGEFPHWRHDTVERAFRQWSRQ
jgi:hypothetical protein